MCLKCYPPPPPPPPPNEIEEVLEEELENINFDIPERRKLMKCGYKPIKVVDLGVGTLYHCKKNHTLRI